MNKPIDIDNKFKIYYPLELKPREQQIDMLNFCKKSINKGIKNILINAPTGSGKSYFIIMFSNWYKNFINSDAKFDIITNSKILQNQYNRDFEFIKSLKGKNNYYCDHHQTSCDEGKEINDILKKKCDHCPYDKAKYEWINSDISSSNFALYNSLSLFTDIVIKRESNVLIIDESHEFENVFCDFISTKLNVNLFKKCGFNIMNQTNLIDLVKKIKSPDDFIDFLDNEFEGLLFNLIDSLKEQIYKNIRDKNIVQTKTKQITYSNGLIQKISNLKEKYIQHKDNWTIDTSFDKDDKIEITMQPIWGYQYLNDLIWDKYDHIIFLSGTILDLNLFSYINGLDSNLTSYIEMDSTFDIKNRPIYYIKCGKMTFADKQKTFKNQMIYIDKILKKYKDKKGIIHTVNYELSNWIKENINDKRLMFHDSTNRDEIYEKFLKSKSPKVIVSPSMMSGIDLKDDLSRFSIILKIPYPNISSKKIKARKKSNNEYYSYRTIIDLIQTYGRTIRSDNDYSDTFILDESFSNILKYNSKYLPRYFTNAIKPLK